MIYFSIYLFSGFLLYLYQKRSKKIILNNTSIKLNVIYIIIAILMLSLLAGLRNNEIGLDVKTYVTVAFNKLQNKSIQDVFLNHNLEIGYELLILSCINIYNDIHFVHFITHLIIVLGVMSFLLNFSNKNDIYLGLLTFLFLYFNTSLNIVRQWLAISVYMYSIKYLINKDYKKYLVFSLIAYLFHNSAIIAFLVFGIYYMLNKKLSCTRVLIIFITFIMILLALRPIVSLLVGYGILNVRYLSYFNSVGNSSIFMQTISRLPILILAFINYNSILKNDKFNKIILIFLFLDLIMGCMSPLIGDASRFSLYFSVWQIYFIPEIYKSIKIKTKTNQRLIISFVFILYLVLYWVYSVVYRNFGNTYPYNSDYFS